MDGRWGHSDPNVEAKQEVPFSGQGRSERLIAIPDFFSRRQLTNGFPRNTRRTLSWSNRGTGSVGNG